MSGLGSLIGWAFLPNLVTGWLQTIYYGIVIRAGDPKPQPGSPRYAEHRRRIYILVVSLYLLYTVYEADFELRRAGSFYADLGVPLDASERDIKTRFRRLAALYHPDKVSGGGGSSAAESAANAYFVHLKTASDTLLDPARRFAYDRFGPVVTSWSRCVTVRDYALRGAQMLVPYYAAAAAGLYGLNLLGYLTWGRFERWLALLVLFVFEMHTLTRPTRPLLLDRVVNPLIALLAPGRPPYLPFQLIALARKLCATFFVALAQIGPVLAADTSTGQLVVGGPAAAGGDDVLLRQGLDRLDATVRVIDADATRLLEMERAPFAGDDEALSNMRAKVKEWLVQNTIRADPMVRDALGRTLTRRRADAPAGARGTR
ncbi:hypothetical protein VTK73DRAFT_7848 [Phialemonium thermophilum]|uniref:J domain-containing protein n=1 Tax=Phialemonium thermophilum TaxID=223376 RepID=A0ABR3WC53_9PEZI